MSSTSDETSAAMALVTLGNSQQAVAASEERSVQASKEKAKKGNGKNQYKRLIEGIFTLSNSSATRELIEH